MCGEIEGEGERERERERCTDAHSYRESPCLLSLDGLRSSPDATSPVVATSSRLLNTGSCGYSTQSTYRDVNIMVLQTSSGRRSRKVRSQWFWVASSARQALCRCGITLGRFWFCYSISAKQLIDFYSQSLVIDSNKNLTVSIIVKAVITAFMLPTMHGRLWGQGVKLSGRICNNRA